MDKEKQKIIAQGQRDEGECTFLSLELDNYGYSIAFIIGYVTVNGGGQSSFGAMNHCSQITMFCIASSINYRTGCFYGTITSLLG